MSKSHGKKTVFMLADTDLSVYCNNSQVTLSTTTTDTTTYGKNSIVKDVSLNDGKLTASGFYDTTAMTGPRPFYLSIRGQKITFTHRPEGTGPGLPQDTGDCIVTSYVQTHPAADYVTWSMDIELSDDVDSTPQS